MTATKETLAALPPLQRRMAEAWLNRFEDGWHPQKLHECMQALPAQSILRRPLLLAMIERDLAHNWQDGRSTPVENYLHDFPELGTVDEISIDLIVAEYHLRQKHAGGADLAEFAERFPSRIDELYLLLKPELFDAPAKAAAPTPTDIVQMRLKLLRAPSNTKFPSNTGLSRVPVRSTASVSEPKYAPPTEGQGATPTPTDTVDSVAGAVDIFAAVAPEQNPPAGNVPEGAWKAVETLRSKSKLGSPKPSDAVTLPRVFGPYAIDKRLGAGGRSATFDAQDTRCDRRVVIKVPILPHAKPEAARSLFQKEARATATVFHPALCPIYEIGQIESIDYFAMPFIDGETLEQVMQRQPVWRPRRAVTLVRTVAAALEVVHRQGVTHRDLRPAHILISTGELPVVIGFGHAGQTQQCTDQTTAAYVAPEVLEDQNLGGPRSDIYSLGVILHELIAGCLPGQVGRAADGSAPSPPTDSALKAIIAKATAPTAQDRYGSMRDLFLELNNYLETNLADLSTEVDGSAKALASRRSDPGTGSGADTGSETYGQMSELRKMSSSVMPGGKRTTTAAHRRSSPWVWYAASAVLGAVFMLTLLILANRNPRNSNSTVATDPKNPKVPAHTGKTSKEPVAGQATMESLLKELIAATSAPSREKLLRQIKERNNAPQDIALIQAKIGEDVWPADSTAETNGKSVLLAALKGIDFNEILPALEQAASYKTVTSIPMRIWACTEAADFGIGEQVEPRWRRILLTALLEDPSSKVRYHAAHVLRSRKFPPDDEMLKALHKRITDDNWLISDDKDSPSKGRNDDSRVEALETLCHVADDRVRDALAMAKKSRNPKVRGWAHEAFREKFPLENP